MLEVDCKVWSLSNGLYTGTTKKPFSKNLGPRDFMNQAPFQRSKELVFVNMAFSFSNPAFQNKNKRPISEVNHPTHTLFPSRAIGQAKHVILLDLRQELETKL
ncbi:MAG: hypothetical protein JRK26_06110 [Deltaproteobacteria bacterium]|nr:hypothetical protein [Deltaproteobacteria bacterium]